MGNIHFIKAFQTVINHNTSRYKELNINHLIELLKLLPSMQVICRLIDLHVLPNVFFQANKTILSIGILLKKCMDFSKQIKQFCQFKFCKKMYQNNSISSFHA